MHKAAAWRIRGKSDFLRPFLILIAWKNYSSKQLKMRSRWKYPNRWTGIMSVLAQSVFILISWFIEDIDEVVNLNFIVNYEERIICRRKLSWRIWSQKENQEWWRNLVKLLIIMHRFWNTMPDKTMYYYLGNRQINKRWRSSNGNR